MKKQTKKIVKAKKNTVKQIPVFLFPTKDAKFDIGGWDVIDQEAGIQINLPEIGKALHIQFGKKPIIYVFTLQKNGDLFENTHTIELDKTEVIKIAGLHSGGNPDDK